jgi:predicted RNA-binding Zn ribbon-like protein
VLRLTAVDRDRLRPEPGGRPNPNFPPSPYRPAFVAGISYGQSSCREVVSLADFVPNAAHELRYEKRDVWLDIRAGAVDLDLVASLMAYRFVEKVLPEPRDRLRICAGNNCSWLFLDRSKAGRRCWCDMAVCGNAAKSRRFYARTRQEENVNPKCG